MRCAAELVTIMAMVWADLIRPCVRCLAIDAPASVGTENIGGGRFCGS